METAQKKETVPDIQAPAKETTAETPAEKPAPAKTDAPAKKQKSDTEYWWKATETDESSEQSDKVPEADAKAPVRTPAPDADKKTAPQEPSASADAKIPVRTPAPDAGTAVPAAVPDAESFEKGRIAGLQEAILAIMEKNGPVTDQMRRDVMANTHHASLVNWIKSFR